MDALEEPSEGTSSDLYARFLSSLTAAYVKRILTDAILMLEASAKTADAEIISALVEGERTAGARTFRLHLDQRAQISASAALAATSASTTLTIESAINAGKRALARVDEAILSRATAVGIGALLYSSPLGNGERVPPTVLSVPGNVLLPELPDNLEEIATANGSIDLPYRIYGDHNQYSLVATPAEGQLSSRVPVRALTFDPTTNSYTFTSSESQPNTLSFPIVHPESVSTVSPATSWEVPIYSGITLTPLIVRPETLPAAELPDFRDCIYCFPAETGLGPIYVVLNSPYEGATTRGKYSGRLYDPSKAGGPTLDLDWTTASITQHGIDSVKVHISRFNASDANAIMIERLEKIFNGELKITDTDKKFYTHELRELERFRALGVADGVLPSDRGTLWNNTHAATLEDYKLRDSASLFYTVEALEADQQQMMREFP